MKPGPACSHSPVRYQEDWRRISVASCWISPGALSALCSPCAEKWHSATPPVSVSSTSTSNGPSPTTDLSVVIQALSFMALLLSLGADRLSDLDAEGVEEVEQDVIAVQSLARSGDFDQRCSENCHRRRRCDQRVSHDADSVVELGSGIDFHCVSYSRIIGNWSTRIDRQTSHVVSPVLTKPAGGLPLRQAGAAFRTRPSRAYAHRQ